MYAWSDGIAATRESLHCVSSLIIIMPKLLVLLFIATAVKFLG